MTTRTFIDRADGRGELESAGSADRKQKSQPRGGGEFNPLARERATEGKENGEIDLLFRNDNPIILP